MDIESQVRAYSYLSSVLGNRYGDPFCRNCHSFLSTVATVQERMQELERDHGEEIEKLPNGMSIFYWVARSGLSGITLPENPVFQKKTGKCKLPDAACFAKSSLAFLFKTERRPLPLRIQDLQPDKSGASDS